MFPVTWFGPNPTVFTRCGTMHIRIRWLRTGDVLAEFPSIEAAHEHLDLVLVGDFRAATENLYVAVERDGRVEPVRPIHALFLAAHERRTQPQLALF